MAEPIPVRINRRIYFAHLSPEESAQPNAKPTYRVRDSRGDYLMHMTQWEVDRCRVYRTDSGQYVTIPDREEDQK